MGVASSARARPRPSPQRPALEPPPCSWCALQNKKDPFPTKFQNVRCMIHACDALYYDFTLHRWYTLIT